MEDKKYNSLEKELTKVHDRLIEMSKDCSLMYEKENHYMTVHFPPSTVMETIEVDIIVKDKNSCSE